MKLKPIILACFGIVPALVALSVYLTTTCRSIWIGDSSEFALALHTLGITHPPGYPLFTITGGAFVALITFLQPIFAANLFNILVASVSVAAIYYIFKRQQDICTAVAMSLVWAFSPLFWGETVGVEIYTLNILMLSLTFLAMESNRNYKWPLTIYLFGLSLGGHPSALSFIPALIWLFIKDREYLRLRRLPLYVGLILLAGTLYLYLPLRSGLNPISDWGHPASLGALIDHMSLKQYSGWVGNSGENLLISVKLYFISLLKSWWWIGIVLVLSGIVTGWKVNRTRTICTLLILLSSVVMAAFHQARNYEPFYLLAMLMSLILIGNNLSWIGRQKLSPTLTGIVYAICLAAAAVMLWVNYDEMDKSEYTLYEDYSKLILDTAEEGILFTAGDINSFGVLYLRYAEGYRSDLEVYDRSIRRQALLDNAERLTDHNFSDYYLARQTVISLSSGRKFLAKNHYQNEPDWLTISEPLHSHGIVYQVNNRPHGRARLLQYPAEYDPGDLMSRQLVAHLDLLHGERALESDPPDSAAALAAFRTAQGRMCNEPRAELLNHLGIYFHKVGYGDLALETYRKALKKPLMTSLQKQEILFNISNIYKDRGNTTLEAGDYQAAVAGFIEALKYDRDNSALLLNIGLIYLQKLNNPQEAKTYLTKYLQLKPNDHRVRDLLNSLNDE